MPLVVQLWSTGLLVFLVKKLLVITTDYWCVLANYCASNLSYHILRYVILNLSIAYMTVFLDALQLLWRRVQPYHHQKRAGKWDPTTASLLIFTIAHQGVHQPWQVFFFVSAWLLRNTLELVQRCFSHVSTALPSTAVFYSESTLVWHVHINTDLPAKDHFSVCLAIGYKQTHNYWIIFISK